MPLSPEFSQHLEEVFAAQVKEYGPLIDGGGGFVVLTAGTLGMLDLAKRGVPLSLSFWVS